jgi:hypothetical protein
MCQHAIAAMVHGIYGNCGVLNNVESASCRCAEVVMGSNPTLTARKQRAYEVLNATDFELVSTNRAFL